MGMKVGVFHEKFEKMIWEQAVFERMDVFWQKVGMRSMSFLENGGFFWQNMGTRSVIFSLKSEISVPYWLLRPIMWCSFDRIDVMLTKYGYDNRELFMKDFKEMTGDYRVCGEVTFFWKKYGHGSIVSFRDWTFFWQNMIIRA